MAGSYEHCCREDGSWIDEDFTGMIENLGDAWEACEHMHFMIQHLANGDRAKIQEASDAYYAKLRGE
jgi:hypothetical protein